MGFTLEGLGLTVREHRERLGLTQDVLGTKAGYGSGAAVSISRIENGLTRPSPERFEGIAAALGLAPSELEREAAERTARLGEERRAGSESEAPETSERLRQRAKRIQREVERRTAAITKLGDEFNHAHDRARDEFFMGFISTAESVSGAPQPDPSVLIDEDGADPEAEAQYRIKFTSYGVAHVLAGGAGGAAAGAAVGGAAAYGTFMAAVSFGTASTGAAISGLSGAAATNAAMALLGGGTLAAGGAGVAGGAALLTGLVVAPALLLSIGGLLWMVKRTRKQQQELAEKLNEADQELEATKRSFDAVVDVLSRATDTLNYVAVHATHALRRWLSRLDSDQLNWKSFNAEEQQRYHDFVEICACVLAVVTINVQEIMTSRGEERERLIEVADEVLTQTRSRIEELV